MTISLEQELEWEPLFEKQRAAARALQAQIDATDAEIDRMVYELYGFTEAENAIVEGGVRIISYPYPPAISSAL